MAKKVKGVWIGELGMIVQPDLGLTVRRGEPFEVDEDWIKARIDLEPHRWKIATTIDVEAWEKTLKAEAEAAKPQAPKG